MSTCRSCGASIEWVTLPSGKRMPVDVLPDDAGYVAIDWDDAGRHTAVVLTEEQIAGYLAPLYVSHFQTCKDANDWRRPR